MMIYVSMIKIYIYILILIYDGDEVVLCSTWKSTLVI